MTNKRSKDLKYNRKCPTVGFRLDNEMKRLLDDLRGELSYGEFLKQLIKKEFDDFGDKIQEAYNSGYKKGFDTGYQQGYYVGFNEGQKRKVIVTHCDKCKNPIPYSIHGLDHIILERFVKQLYGYKCSVCGHSLPRLDASLTKYVPGVYIGDLLSRSYNLLTSMQK